jgi:uncharacterized protein YxeA
MKGFLCLLVLVAAGVIGLGFYLGWFHIDSDSANGKSRITFSVDTDKIGAPTEKRMNGVVVSVNSDKLTMTNKEGKEQTHTLTADSKVTCDGKVCTAADLKPGMRIRVTTEKVEPHTVTRIEALDDNPDFEKGA